MKHNDPRPQDVFPVRGVVYIIEEFIDGLALEGVWHRLSAGEQRNATAQLKDCFERLRPLKSLHILGAF